MIALKPFLQFIWYRKDRGAELRDTTPTSVVSDALRFTMPCAECGRSMHPFRKRDGWTQRGTRVPSVYVALTCASEGETKGCSRGAKARDAMKALRAALRGEFQAPLFDV